MSSQVGSGHVSIFPVMKGFRSRVSKEMKSAGSSGSRDFASSMKSAGRTTGAKLGRDLKSTFKSATGDLGAGALRGVNREVATSSSALSKARLRQQDTAGKVRVAEARLQEAVAKSGEGSARAIAAEERLATARRAHKTATDQVSAATARLKGAQDALKNSVSTQATSSWWARLGESAKSGAQGFLASVRDIGSRAGQALGNAIKGTATAGVAVAATGITVALSKGFSRLTGIDTARAKLEGLGHDGKTVGTIMDNATAAVRGTAFGLGEAATVASGAVASGIKPGKQLESVLKGVANVAAATNRTMEDTGSIFNNVRANQAAYTQDIKQLANAGLPIWDALQKATGKTQAEVRKMATNGEIDFQLFSDAAADAAGKVAETMGNTIPSSVANFWASVGRIGANALGGIDKDTGEMYGLYARIAPLIQSITKALGPVEAAAKRWGETLDSKVGPILEKVTGFFDRLSSGSDDLKSKFSGLAPILAPVGAAFAALGSGGLAGMLSRIPMLGGMLGGLTGPLAALGGPLGIAAAALAGFVLSGADADGLVTGLTGMIDQIVAGIPGFVDKIVTLVPELVQGILSKVPVLVDAAIGIVNALVNGIAQALPLLIEGAIALVTGLIGAIIENLPLLIEGAIALVNALLDAIITLLPLIIEGGVQLLMALVMGIINALPQLIDGVITLISALLGAIVENLPLIIDAGITLLLSLVNGLIEALPELITAAITLVLQLVAGLLTMLPELIVAGIELIVALITGLIEAIPQIIEMLPQIISAIWDGLTEVDWLGLGAQIIQGIIDGFFSMVGAVGDAIGSVVGTIMDFFPNSPAKRGPLGPAGWRKIRTSGTELMGQFTDGAEDGADGFGTALDAITRESANRAQMSMSVASRASTANAPASSKETRIEQNNYFDKEDPEIGAEIAKRKIESILEGV